MLNESNLHEYQRTAVQHIIEHPYGALLMEMGLGKSISTLTAIKKLMDEYLEVNKVLVIAPKRVAESTWSDEIAKWEHLKGLTVSKILGTEKQRKAALKAPADIFVINRENVVWLVSHLQGYWPFDMIVIDELSSFKSSKSARFRALRLVRPKTNRVVGLTGTPVPNGLIDLWSQLYLLDLGERLGKTITSYRSKYFRPGRSNGQIVFDYKLNSGSEEAIYKQIGDICISMKAEDYLQLPERIDRTVEVHLPEKMMNQYLEFEKDQVLALENEDGDISAVNAAALSNKLLQFSNGAVYDSERNVHDVHAEKLDALEEIVEAANGQSVLVFFSFRHDVSRILRKLKSYHPKEIGGPEDIKAWNEGDIPVLLAHPAGAGHGLNLQAGGHIVVWFGLPWSSELYQQANARLYRQGQNKPVIIHHLIAKGTMDEDVMKALAGKIDKQEALMQAVKARIQKWRK
ncbi:DEAD/DEAH box helicase [Bacteroides sp. A1-P5]|uniref:DEAD/DEAH box helicase n=1 Tax=Bacteroides vicugnae TaxID=3037989 RepID=A0ABU5HJX8_9BACE|nr:MULTISPECIES: DEAD/DEAH box helicase [unclassified Bacteroides]MCS2336759.1 DEAD/DEAH box helicase [Bacteroides sp. BFG-606]MDY7252048.1 DEAD/DEAH box helicase [Bacteroides sp. A1-P5]MDY7256503.1 DEAD/DEAH box helicase [Bacteroides sp. A2-P53]